MASVNEKRFFVKIEAGPKAGGNPCTYHNNGFPFPVFTKWKWYFEYRAALLKVNNPRHTVTLLTGSYDYIPPRDVVMKELKNKLAGKKRTISKYTNLLALAEKHWDKLFPISEDVLYIKAADKINRLKKELEQLEIQWKEYEANN